MSTAGILNGNIRTAEDERRSRARRSSVGLNPIFVLAPPRSFTSIVCAMLGQHPDLYSFPETQLFTTETVADKLAVGPQTPHRIRHGLLRVVAQLYFGEQSDSTIALAGAWLRRRAHFSTGYVFELLAEKVSPLTPVEKSPDVVYDMASLRRALGFFPNARFIHLVRHPWGYCESNLLYYRRRLARGRQLPPWMFCSAAVAGGSGPADGRNTGGRVLDPQRGWYLHNSRIRRFCDAIPEAQSMWIRGEDVIGQPDQGLRRIADWLGLRSDAGTIDRMKHPERSSYASIGPSTAPYGNSRSFLENPTLRSDVVGPCTLDEPLPWRSDNCGFLPRVKQLAAEFGYS
jgi:Sulfotransferase family